VAAGWALRELADPATLPKVLAYVRGPHVHMAKISSETEEGAEYIRGFDEQMSQLVQLLGKRHYRAADSFLRQIAPRDHRHPGSPYGAKTRAAVFWALGCLHENDPDADVVKIAEKPLRDVMRLIFDDVRVFQMCAIALGRMRSKESVSLLRSFFRYGAPSLDPLNNAAGWAIEHITQKPIPHDAAVVHTIGGWFLRPTE
jgi:hypothetical protein